jgi:hypothetical protein
MNLTDIFSRRELRRCWLLNKALENAPFDEALKLAQVADEFLSANKPETSASILTKPAICSSQRPLYAGLSDSVLSLPVERERDHLHPADIGRDLAETVIVELCGSLEGTSDDQASNPETSSQVMVENSLQALASQDDIVRYLRQRDDVVVRDGANAFLINGRFRLNFDEMLARANNMRERQGKPPFSVDPRKRGLSPSASETLELSAN